MIHIVAVQRLVNHSSQRQSAECNNRGSQEKISLKKRFRISAIPVNCLVRHLLLHASMSMTSISGERKNQKGMKEKRNGAALSRFGMVLPLTAIAKRQRIV